MLPPKRGPSSGLGGSAEPRFPTAACLVYPWEMHGFCACSLCRETDVKLRREVGRVRGLCFAAPRGVEGMRLGVCVRRPHHLLSPTGMGTPHRGRPLTIPSPHWQAGGSRTLPLPLLDFHCPPAVITLHPARLLGAQG